MTRLPARLRALPALAVLLLVGAGLIASAGTASNGNPTSARATFLLIAPDGSTAGPFNLFATSPEDATRPELPSSGTWRVHAVPPGGGTGTVTFTVTNVAPPTDA